MGQNINPFSFKLGTVQLENYTWFVKKKKELYIINCINLIDNYFVD